MKALDLEAFRRQVREAHPKAAAELIRQLLGVIEARASRLGADVESLGHHWRVREWRLGRHPEPEDDPHPNADDERTAASYHLGARAAAAVEIVLATVLGFFAGYGMTRIPIALGCCLLALALITIAKPSVRAWFCDEERPLETRRRLTAAAKRAIIAACLSLLPLLLLLRGGGGQGTGIAIALSWIPLTLSLSALNGIFAALAECHADLLAREHRHVEDERVRLDLFREELLRLLDELPLRPARNGRNGRRKVAAGCLAALLLMAGPAFAFTTIEVLVDTTGSVDPVAMDRAGALLAASLPSLVQRLGVEQVEVGGWGATSVWLPPAISVSFPHQSEDVEERPVVGDLDRYFAAYAQAEEAERRQRLSQAELTHTEAVKKGCAEAAALIRRLGRAGVVPEKGCTPLGDLLVRCAGSPASTLVIVLTDGLTCEGSPPIPASGAGETIVILVPGKGPNGRKLGQKFTVFRAQWLRAIPCSLLDERGEWFQSVASEWSVSQDPSPAGIAP